MFPFLGGTAVVSSLPAPLPDRENEDAAAVIHQTPCQGVLAVADGVGGGRSGGAAARLAVETLGETVAAAGEDDTSLRMAILEGMEEASRRIRAWGTGAATTLAVALISEHRLQSFHVGDSLILVVGQRGKIKHRSIDHGPVGYALEAGFLGESEAMRHEERHVVTNVVGNDDMRIEVGPTLRLAARDTVLLASDGMSDNLYQSEIVEMIRKGPMGRAAHSLLSTCRHRMTEQTEGTPSKVDDLSLVMFRR